MTGVMSGFPDCSLVNMSVCSGPASGWAAPQSVRSSAFPNERTSMFQTMRSKTLAALGAWMLLLVSIAAFAFVAQRAQAHILEQLGSFAQFSHWLAVLSVSALLLAVTWAFVAIRKVSVQLGPKPVDIDPAFKKVADGGHSPVPGAQEASMGSLLAALGRMEQALALMVTQVRDSRASIATGTGQTVVGNADLCPRTETQTSNLHEASACMAPLPGNLRRSTDTARDAGRSTADIVKQVNDVARTIRKISESAMSQSVGIGQAHVAVSELDEVTQQNAALIGQSAASVESLRQQAFTLQRLLSHFRI
jgi:methyl-accepting chemotaxis protein